MSGTRVPNLGETRNRMGSSGHIAHAEGWSVICTSPDFCKVGGFVVAFNSFAILDENILASPNVRARGTPIYRQGDVLRNVQGDAGKHVVSGTSLSSGYIKILEGHSAVKANGSPVAHHESKCLVNCDATGNGGTLGKIVTAYRSRTPTNVSASAREIRSIAKDSTRLEALLAARERLAGKSLDFDDLDQYVDFAQAHKYFDGLVSSIDGKSNMAADYGAQFARGAIGFIKDFTLGAGEAVYEAVKGVPKLARRTFTPEGRLMTQLDAEIVAERIRLGHISLGSVQTAGVEVGKALVQPIADPWKRGDYVEAVTRGAAETVSLGFGLLKGAKATQAGNAAISSRSASTVSRVGDGIHVVKARKPAFSGDWDNYRTLGLKTDPLESAEGRRLMAELEKQGYSRAEAWDEASKLLRSGSTLPMANPIEVGDKFYKVVDSAAEVGPNSAFWMSEKQLAELKGLSYDQIADKLGVPLASQQGATLKVVEITAVRPATSFTSVIAPTAEIGANGAVWSQSGGGLQTLLVDRTAFTPPRVTNIRLP